MNKLAATAGLCILLPAMAFADQAQVQIKQEEQSAFKGFLYQVWSNLRSMTPNKSSKQTHYRVTATAGIRGNESTESLLEPYWKGDLAEDPHLKGAFDTYLKAQKQMDDGQLREASLTLDKLIQNHGDSHLLANALFAKGLVSAGLGNKEQGGQAMKRFVNEFPKHPLVDDAKGVLGQLGYSS